jgi:hypothetical protein
MNPLVCLRILRPCPDILLGDGTTISPEPEDYVDVDVRAARALIRARFAVVVG